MQQSGNFNLTFIKLEYTLISGIMAVHSVKKIARN